MDEKKTKLLQDEVNQINNDMNINNTEDEYNEDPINIMKTGISFGPKEKEADVPEEVIPEEVVPEEKIYDTHSAKPSAIVDTKNLTEEVIPKIQKITDEFREKNSGILKKKINSIRIGKLVTIIYGDFNAQKVLNGKVMSMLDSGITILSIDKDIVDPVVVPFDMIIDIFEVKSFKKKKTEMSIFKINKAIREFFSGNEEELKHAYEQKISVKKLRQELRKKDRENK